jgi:hypothetical protein
MHIGTRAFSALAVLLLATAANATTIDYDAVNLGGSSWRYDYTVVNDALAAPLEELTIFFDLGLFSNLSVVTSPAGWDSIVIQPDPGLPDNGFFDSLALAGGLAWGASQDGFSVSFDWLGANAPGAQLFSVVDPTDFHTIESGLTSTSSTQPPAGVPEPGPLTLVSAALAGIALARRRRRSTSES